MDGNRDDAERCLEMAAAALAAADLPRATRLLDKSRRMFPLTAEQDALAASIAAAARGTNGSGSSSMRNRGTTKTKPASSSTSSTTPSSSSTSTSTSKATSAKRPPADEKPAPPRPATPAMRAAVRAVLHPPDQTHYAVLGVPRDADGAAIKRAYRKLALRLHPDRNFAPDAENAFKRVSRAFSTLSDPSRRTHYDQCGTDDPSEPPSAGPQSASAAHAAFAGTPFGGMPFGARARTAHMRGQPMDFDTFIRVNGGAVSADDLLDFLFTGMAPRPAARQRSAPRQRRRRRSATDDSDDDDDDDDAPDARARQRAAAAAGDDDEGSLWQRLRPLLWILLFMLFSLLLSDQPTQRAFALHRSDKHPVSHVTPNGSPFYTARSAAAARDARVWRAVDAATLDRLRAQCQIERDDEARLRARASAWLVGSAARAAARRRLDALRKPGCESALRLYDAMRRYG